LYWNTKLGNHVLGKDHSRKESRICQGNLGPAQIRIAIHQKVVNDLQLLAILVDGIFSISINPKRRSRLVKTALNRCSLYRKDVSMLYRVILIGRQASITCTYR
jgi:hypothetical protein